MTAVHLVNSSLPSTPHWRVSLIAGIAIDFGGGFGGKDKKRVEAQISDYNPQAAPRCGSSPFNILAQRESVSTLNRR
jgi:hypothetical protein